MHWNENRRWSRLHCGSQFPISVARTALTQQNIKRDGARTFLLKQGEQASVNIPLPCCYECCYECCYGYSGCCASPGRYRASDVVIISAVGQYLLTIHDLKLTIGDMYYSHRETRAWPA